MTHDSDDPTATVNHTTIAVQFTPTGKAEPQFAYFWDANDEDLLSAAGVATPEPSDLALLHGLKAKAMERAVGFADLLVEQGMASDTRQFWNDTKVQGKNANIVARLNYLTARITSTSQKLAASVAANQPAPAPPVDQPPST